MTTRVQAFLVLGDIVQTLFPYLHWCLWQVTLEPVLPEFLEPGVRHWEVATGTEAGVVRPESGYLVRLRADQKEIDVYA